MKGRLHRRDREIQNLAATDDASVLTDLSTFKAHGSDRWMAAPEQLRLGMNLVRGYGFDRALAAA